MIAGIVLAAGESTRMGQPKQLMLIGQHTMLQHVVGASVLSKLDALYVVIGHKADEVRASFLNRKVINRKVTFVDNPDYKEGIGASVRAGVAALPPDADAAMFLLGDQPFLPRGLLNQLISRSTPENIVAPSFCGQRKNPTIFGRKWFPELLQATGDSGGRTIIEAHPEALELVELAADIDDFDTPEDAKRLLHDLAMDEIRDAYDVAGRMLTAPLAFINRPRPKAHRYRSNWELAREFHTRAASKNDFAMVLGLISLEDFKQILREFHQNYPDFFPEGYVT